MKARIILPPKDTDKFMVSYKELKKTVEEEFTKKRYEVYADAAQDITVQVLSNVLKTLEIFYGWKQSRLEKFIACLHDYEDDMVRFGITTVNNYNEIKDKFSIDLVKEFPAHVRGQDEPEEPGEWQKIIQHIQAKEGDDIEAD